MLHLWCMATCCIVGLSHKISDNQGTQCWWICDVGYNHACSAVLVPCYVLLIRIVVHYSLVSGAAVIFLIYGSKYGAGAWFGVDKSHLAKSHAAPPDWQAFLTGFRFFSKFSIVHIAERAERRNRFCLLIAPAIIIFPQESKTLEKQRLTAPRPLNTAFHIAKNFHRWKTVDKVSKKACIFSIFDPYSCQCPGFGSKFVLLQIVKL